MNYRKPVRNEETIWRRFEENIFIFNPETGYLSRLNITAARIWEMLDGKHATKDIIDNICSEFKSVDVHRVKKGLTKFLKELEERKLIDWR